MSAAIIRLSRWPRFALWLVVAAAMPVAAATPGEAQTPAFTLRGEGSFPLQYIETTTARSDTRNTNVVPYLGLVATTEIAPNVSASVFADGGHGQLGSFLDTDNTFASGGASIARRWGMFTAGVSLEHTHYFEGTFGEETNIANDANLFAHYRWHPNPNLRIRPAINATVRADAALAVQRYSASARIDIEQRLAGPWWFIVSPRIRHLDYVGETSRHDTRLALVTGLKYVINDAISARMLTGWESRTSTDPSRAANKFTIGASLDFDIDLVAPRWPR